MFYKIGNQTKNLFWGGNVFDGWRNVGKKYSKENVLAYIEKQLSEKDSEWITRGWICSFDEVGQKIEEFPTMDFYNANRKVLLESKIKKAKKELKILENELKNL